MKKIDYNKGRFLLFYRKKDSDPFKDISWYTKLKILDNLFDQDDLITPETVLIYTKNYPYVEYFEITFEEFLNNKIQYYNHHSFKYFRFSGSGPENSYHRLYYLI
jgi:hypothetical protein